MDKRVFVSSTYQDLKEYRKAVQASIRQYGAIDISMENFGARDERPKAECLKIIREETEVFVGIYAHRQGSEDFSDVDHTLFFLGKYWGNQIFRVENDAPLIGITISAYGPTLCLCRVIFKDGHQADLSRYLDFEMGTAPAS